MIAIVIVLILCSNGRKTNTNPNPNTDTTTNVLTRKGTASLENTAGAPRRPASHFPPPKSFILLNYIYNKSP